VGVEGGEWKLRARRAEAEAAATRAAAVSARLQGDARALQLERELNVTKESVSWRITKPLRAVNAWRKALRHRENGRYPPRAEDG
jgi:hypothetical protein